MPVRSVGLAACAMAVLLLAIALISGRMAYSAPAALKGATPAATGAWVRLPAVSGRPAAGYLTLSGGEKAEVLTGASSPAAERVELHESAMADGRMRMNRLSSVPLPVGGTVSFAPGGLHLMLFGLKAQPGDSVPITLELASGATLSVKAQARPASAHAPAGNSEGGAAGHRPR
jgi:copper(I)-binding protein